MAAQCGRAPQLAAGTNDVFGVECAGDCLWAQAVGEIAEDAPDHRGLARVDGAFTADWFAAGVELLHHVIAIAKAAASLALPSAILRYTVERESPVRARTVGRRTIFSRICMVFNPSTGNRCAARGQNW